MKPELLRTLNGIATLLWTAMLPIALLTPLKTSLPFIVGVSIYANIASHLSAWVAGRAEVMASPDP
jgi:hypothetical protein